MLYLHPDPYHMLREVSAPPSEPPCRSRPVEPIGRWPLFGNSLRSPFQSATNYKTSGRQLYTFQRSANRWSVTHYAPPETPYLSSLRSILMGRYRFLKSVSVFVFYRYLFKSRFGFRFRFFNMSVQFSGLK